MPLENHKPSGQAILVRLVLLTILADRHRSWLSFQGSAGSALEPDASVQPEVSKMLGILCLTGPPYGSRAGSENG